MKSAPAVHPHEDQGVAAARVPLVGRRVRADQEDVLGLAGQGGPGGRAGGPRLGRVRRGGVQGVVERDVGARRHRDDEADDPPQGPPGDRQPQAAAPAGHAPVARLPVRRLVAARGAHARRPRLDGGRGPLRREVGELDQRAAVAGQAVDLHELLRARGARRRGGRTPPRARPPRGRPPRRMRRRGPPTWPRARTGSPPPAAPAPWDGPAARRRAGRSSSTSTVARGSSERTWRSTSSGSWPGR